MKKILSALIALVMLMSCLPAFAETESTVYGTWYVSYTITPEGVLSVPGDAGFSQKFTINEDGTCVFDMSNYLCQSNSSEGTWAINAEGIYELSFNGEVMFYVNIVQGMLVAAATDNSMYYCTRNPGDAQQVLSFSSYSENAADTDFFGDWECGAVLYTNAQGNYDYYSKYILDLNFTVSIGYDRQIGGYVADWYIGGVGSEQYNEQVFSHAVYEMDAAGDTSMYSFISLSNGFNTTVFMYLDSTGETMHVYGLYGILVFTKADSLQERPAVIEEVFAMYSEQE